MRVGVGFARQGCALAMVLTLAGIADAADFTCYRAAPTRGAARFTARPGVSVVDEFGSSTVDVRKPKLLCAPADVNGDDPGAPSRPDHLEDYFIKPATRFTTLTRQTVVDRFGTWTFDVKKAIALQVPTAKSHKLLRLFVGLRYFRKPICFSTLWMLIGKERRQESAYGYD